ncbi:phosphonate metabolism transcriptional regulator PhnF [Bordetella genomosp. 13]|uniref:phosphonate metabolism transcriptional regulator PhnF n=1 Tax=Bordetella genomosp. 13 TaxID=463040 RepID=UPI00119FABFF|nr:phosphonate metabolism transcriptional regulator PhnF [Bordetella genomosp. 13]
MVERGSGVAVWRQIGELLADDIRKKLYAPGERLPPEPELAARYAVNRHTIRRAMGELEQSGLVRIEQGRGTFVQEHAIDYAIGKRTRFSENLRRQGLPAHLQFLGKQLLRHAEAAAQLDLPRNAELLRVQMLGKSGQRVIDVSEHYFDARRFPDLAEKLDALGSVSKAYAEYGIADYTRKWSRITAAIPDPDVARLLGQPKTRPILQVEALNVDVSQAPLQYSVTRFGGDFVQLVVSDDET